MKKFKVVIIDDERLAREEIKRHLLDYDDFEIAGTAENADEAEGLITSLRPDLIFLDIQMPGKSGFDLLEALEDVPEVIFITAYDQFAVKAFEVSAIDYLVKPFREERFDKAIIKAKERLEGKKEARSFERNIFVKEGEKLHFIKTREVYLVTSLGNYVRLHFSGQKVYLKRSLNQLEEMLDPALFFRISRTEIINTSFIKEVDTSVSERLTVVLETGERLIVSSRRSAALKRRHRPLG
jgi:two-component system LytT family response regulator